MSQTPDAQPLDTSFKVNGVTVQPIGAGTKRKKQTSSIWKHVEFTPATRDGKNVECMVKEAAVNAKNAAAGPTDVSPVSVS